MTHSQDGYQDSIRHVELNSCVNEQALTSNKAKYAFFCCYIHPQALQPCETEASRSQCTKPECCPFGKNQSGFCHTESMTCCQQEANCDWLNQHIEGTCPGMSVARLHYLSTSFNILYVMHSRTCSRTSHNF